MNIWLADNYRVNPALFFVLVGVDVFLVAVFGLVVVGLVVDFVLVVFVLVDFVLVDFVLVDFVLVDFVLVDVDLLIDVDLLVDVGFVSGFFWYVVVRGTNFLRSVAVAPSRGKKANSPFLSVCPALIPFWIIFVKFFNNSFFDSSPKAILSKSSSIFAVNSRLIISGHIFSRR